MNGTTSKNVGPYIVAAIVTGFLIVIAYMMFFTPKMDESKKLVSQAATAHVNNAALTNRVDKLKGIAGNLDPLKAQISDFNRAYPSDARQQEMIDAINDAAGSTGVTLKTLSPSAPVPKAPSATAVAPVQASQATQEGTNLPGPAPVAKAAAATPDPASAQLGGVTVKIDGEGSLDAVQAFITKVEGLKRPLLVHEMSIEKLENSYHVTLNGETFLAAALVAPKADSAGTTGSQPETSK